jgi:hypothetical protein
MNGKSQEPDDHYATRIGDASGMRAFPNICNFRDMLRDETALQLLDFSHTAAVFSYLYS